MRSGRKTEFRVVILVLVLGSVSVFVFSILATTQFLTGRAGSRHEMSKAVPADAKIALDNKDIEELYDAVGVGTGVSIEGGGARPGEHDAFAGAAKHSRATIEIQSSVSGGPWTKSTAIYPLKGQNVVLKVDEVAGANIRWFQIIPDTTKIYKNANLPWEKEAYQWVGFAKIDYQRIELTHFRGLWEIQLFANEENREIGVEKSTTSGPLQCKVINSRFYHEDVGSFWFQAEVAKAGTIYRSAGIEDSDYRGLSPQVLRVSIRDGEGYVGYLTSFFNVPGLFGSVTYQSNNYIGADCADVLMAAYGKWKGEPINKNYNVAMLVNQWPKVKEFDLLEGTANKRLKWGRDIRPGDFIAVRYRGSRQYQHIGALYSDANKNSVLDGGDVVIHAGPQALHYSHLEEGNFDGHIVVLRP
jgi:hypothetical protein